jgi:hypothetical protein
MISMNSWLSMESATSQFQRARRHRRNQDCRTDGFDHFKNPPRFFAGHPRVYVYSEDISRTSKWKKKLVLRTIIELQTNFLCRR